MCIPCLILGNIWDRWFTPVSVAAVRTRAAGRRLFHHAEFYKMLLGNSFFLFLTLWEWVNALAMVHHFEKTTQKCNFIVCKMGVCWRLYCCMQRVRYSFVQTRKSYSCFWSSIVNEEERCTYMREASLCHRPTYPVCSSYIWRLSCRRSISFIKS